MDEFDHLRVDLRDPIATITVERPDKLNALGTHTLGELERAVRAVESVSVVRGAIITGSGEKAFAAGADIAELAHLDSAGAAELSRLGQRVFRSIELARKPIVAAVNGFALGGGCELALACHLRTASRTASFALPEVKLGTMPGYGGTLRLPRLVGKGRALELILTGKRIGADEAHRIGLVNRVSEPDDLIAETRALLESIIANAPVALGFAIESVTRGLESSIEDGLGLEASLFGLLAATSDMREGVSAFLEKRAAEFRGG